MFKLFKKKSTPDTITLYSVYRGPSSEVDIKKDLPLYYTSSHDQARLAVERLIYINHSIHFNLWCAYRKLSTEFHGEAWNTYLHNLHYKETPESLEYRLPPEDTFSIIELTYTSSDIASLLRIFTDNIPLLLGFEREPELYRYIKSHGKDGTGYIVPPELAAVRSIDSNAKLAIDTFVKQINKNNKTS